MPRWLGSGVLFPDGRIWSSAAGNRPVAMPEIRRGHPALETVLANDQDPVAVALFVA